MRMDNITAEVLLERYATGERNFAGVSISHQEVFQDVDLTGISLAGSDLNCRFENVTLANADFSGAGLGATFINVDLTDASFVNGETYRCKFQNVKLLRANLQKIRISTSWIYGCDLSMADLSQSKLYIVRVEDSNFSGANFTKSWIYDFRVEKSCLRQASRLGRE